MTKVRVLQFMSMIIDPHKNTSVMRLGTTLKKTILQPFLGQQILVTSPGHQTGPVKLNHWLGLVWDHILDAIDPFYCDSCLLMAISMTDLNLNKT